MADTHTFANLISPLVASLVMYERAGDGNDLKDEFADHLAETSRRMIVKMADIEGPHQEAFRAAARLLT
jgi:hypothetical protein